MPENYILLERIELNTSVSSVALNNIPQSGYTDLKIVCSTRTDYAGFLDLNMFLNGNASSGYSWRRLNGDGGSATSTNSTSAGVIPSPTLGTTATANTFASTEIYIPNYTSTTSKSVSIDGVTENNATTSYQSFTAGLSTLSTAITSVNFGLGAGNFVAGSTFSLYGIAALGTTPVIAPKAIGGNRIDNDGTYWYHTYTSSGSFTPLQGLTTDVLVVAGGGGTKSTELGGGGGGAGGLLAFTSQALTTTSYDVAIGGGGVLQTSGTNTTFGALTAAVGGGRGAAETIAGATGGSGGGGAHFGNATGYAASPSGQGTAGGNGYTQANYAVGGGGGGATVAGGNGTLAGGGGLGGNGSSAYSSWGLATTTGQNISGTVWYAGGGGGGAYNGTQSTGGNGGGGAGGRNGGAAIAGTINTGGGAGGAGQNGTGANGGSGIVIVRYPIA
jgi:hypothetical protein